MEAEAVELIKCLLLAAERAGESSDGQRAALLGRFTEQQLARAHAFLVDQGQVYAGGISRAYALSDAFKASLQVRPVPYLASACVLPGTSVKVRAVQRNASLYSSGHFATLAQLLVVAYPKLQHTLRQSEGIVTG